MERENLPCDVKQRDRIGGDLGAVVEDRPGHASADAHFFELGGHSLLVVRLVDELTRKFGVTLAIHELFQLQILSKLADYIAAAHVPSKIKISDADALGQDEVEEVV